jgi:hypothetical protein
MGNGDGCHAFEVWTAKDTLYSLIGLKIDAAGSLG